MVYLPTWMVDFYGFHVGKYTSPMDPMGMNLNCFFFFFFGGDWLDTPKNHLENMTIDS